MIQIRSLAECSLDDVLHVWNRGFADYEIEVQMTLEGFLQRMLAEGLCPTLSFIAYVKERPAGILLSGIRTVDEQRIAWNGGTAVIREWRGQQLGDLLVENLLARYQVENVDIARLEAIHSNKKAIKLYEKWGYHIREELFYLNGHDIQLSDYHGQYDIEDCHPGRISQLSFYREDVPWQTQWQSNRGGKAVLVRDMEGVVGYALYRENYNSKGEVTAIYLLQCEAKPGHADEKSILASLLEGALQSRRKNVSVFAVNLPHTRNTLIDLLLQSGFSTLLKQVHMEKQL